ncbi:hypothetical protein C8Q80DRAFT_1111407 [Daedaleopsis nitida]|nr:hypothetical protein C8Q80DRAFT_1111407 [Daedaleopsis nitida]
MPTNITVSHVSPLLSYIPRDAWFEGDQSDPDLSNYTYASYHATNHSQFQGASLAFSWWGTALVYGGYRRRLGDYQVTIDGVTTLHEGYVSGLDEQFDYVLFNSTSLPAGQHQIRITNMSQDPKQPVLDVSRLVFQTPLEQGYIMDHSDPSCSWFPTQPSVWVASSTSRATDNSLGAMEVTFTVCSGFVLYGHIDETSGPVSVSVDGRTSHPLSPNTSIPPRTNDSHVLFAVTGLNEGTHNLWVENNPVNAISTRRRVDLSYGMVLSVRGNSAMQPPTDGTCVFSQLCDV